jgi:hypothetical protein
MTIPAGRAGNHGLFGGRGGTGVGGGWNHGPFGIREVTAGHLVRRGTGARPGTVGGPGRVLGVRGQESSVEDRRARSGTFASGRGDSSAIDLALTLTSSSDG